MEKKGKKGKRYQKGSSHASGNKERGRWTEK